MSCSAKDASRSRNPRGRKASLWICGIVLLVAGVLASAWLMAGIWLPDALRGAILCAEHTAPTVRFRVLQQLCTFDGYTRWFLYSKGGETWRSVMFGLEEPRLKATSIGELGSPDRVEVREAGRAITRFRFFPEKGCYLQVGLDDQPLDVRAIPVPDVVPGVPDHNTQPRSRWRQEAVSGRGASTSATNRRDSDATW